MATPLDSHVAHERLERLTNELLRDQPPLQAPASLEARVFSQVAARRALPWWRKSFKHWPAAARLAFIAGSAGIVKLAFVIMNLWNVGASGKSLTESFAPEITVARVVPSVFTSLANTVPSTWLYVGIGVVAIAYFMFFGLGALAYRTLYAPRLQH